MSFLQTRFAHRLGLALGRVHDGFGAQHGPNLGRFWSHVGIILAYFWMFFWLLNLTPLEVTNLSDLCSIYNPPANQKYTKTYGFCG